jgi:hypothetical protein
MFSPSHDYEFSDHFYNLSLTSSEPQVVVSQFVVTIEFNLSQKIITFFSPLVIFNHLPVNISISDQTLKTSFEIAPMQCQMLSPPSFPSGMDNFGLIVKSENTSSALIPSIKSVKSVLYLASTANESLFLPLRYDIALRPQTSILTFTPLLVVKNTMAFFVLLQPLDSNQHPIESPQKFQADEEKVFSNISKIFLCLATFESSISPVLLSFDSEHHSVFRFFTEDSSMNIELEIVDNGASLASTFRTPIFPTPICIANFISDTTVQAYQKDASHPFLNQPFSISLFAFDLPFSDPSIYLTFG